MRSGPRVDRFGVELAMFAALMTACGARGGLDLSERGDVPVDGGSIDDAGTRRDAGTMRDSGMMVRDGGPLDAGMERCLAGAPFEITRRAARIDWPALARVENQALLVFTEYVREDAPLIVAQAITPSGSVTGPAVDVGPGYGATVVPKWLEDFAPGFTLAFVTPERQIRGARFNVDGSPDIVAGTGFGMTDSPRPALLLSERLAVNAWESVGGLDVRGIAADVLDGARGELALPGQQSPVVASSTRAGVFLLASHDGGRARIAQYDARGTALTERFVDLSDGTFPAAVAGALVVEGAPDASVVWGGAIRAIETFTLYAELGTWSASWTRDHDHIWDAAAAYDTRAGRLGVAAGVRHDEGIGRMPAPHVFFYVIDRARAAHEIIVAGPILERAPGELHVATLATGIQSAPFLVVWTELDVDVGVVMGSLVTCG